LVCDVAAVGRIACSALVGAVIQDFDAFASSLLANPLARLTRIAVFRIGVRSE
jgi:hypothetical protein